MIKISAEPIHVLIIIEVNLEVVWLHELQSVSHANPKPTGEVLVISHKGLEDCGYVQCHSG